MPLMIVLNTILGFAAVVIVLSPLIWAILTQHRDEPAPGGTAGSSSRATAPRTRRTRRPRQAPTAWPAR
jgi:hypothetical protein